MVFPDALAGASQSSQLAGVTSRPSTKRGTRSLMSSLSSAALRLDACHRPFTGACRLFTYSECRNGEEAS
jgi:hypothetical protein